MEHFFKEYLWSLWISETLFMTFVDFKKLLVINAQYLNEILNKTFSVHDKVAM